MINKIKLTILLFIILFSLQETCAFNVTQHKEYEVWKEQQRKSWGAKSTLPEQLAALANSANNALGQARIELEPQNAIYPYNFLRELLGLPLVSSLADIDKLWLEQILPEVELFTVIEEREWLLPTEAQKELVFEASRLLNLQQEIVALNFGALGGEAITKGERRYLALCQTPDLDIRLAILYHELGHIVHHDIETARDVMSHKQDPIAVVNAPDFKSDLEEIKSCFELGLTTLTLLKNTKIGNSLTQALTTPKAQEVLKEYGVLWIPPENQQEKDELIYLRGIEQRADLFSLKQLLKLKNTSSILAGIYTMGLREKIILNEIVTEGTKEKHPSLVERSIYMIGFLAKQGFNVVHLFEAWEKEGICLVENQATGYAKLFSPAWDSTTNSVIKKAYEAWKEKKFQEDYSLWKQKKQEYWQKMALTPLARQIELLRDWNKHLTNLEENPSSKSEQSKLLFTYNYLREMTHLPLVSFWKNMNLSWIQEKKYQISKDKLQANWEGQKLTPLGQKADLIFLLTYRLDTLKEHPDNEQLQKEALFNYNFLREMTRQPRVSDWKSINSSWVEQEDYKVWKEQKQEILKEQNLTLKEQKVDIVRNINRLVEQEVTDPYNRRELIFSYNYLRELASKPPIQSIKQIDPAFLSEQQAELNK